MNIRPFKTLIADFNIENQEVLNHKSERSEVLKLILVL